MNAPPQRYPDDHWIRSFDSEKALNNYLDQQSKAYSKVKNDFVRELLGDLQDKRVLDYGCGAGYFCVYAAKAGAAEVLGVDVEHSVSGYSSVLCQTGRCFKSCRFYPERDIPQLWG